MATNKKEEIKAWLGINWRDTIGNVGGLVSLLGFFSSNKIIIYTSFAVSFALMSLSLLIYFLRPNKKINKTSYILNIVFNIVAFSMLTVLMILRIIF